MEKSIVVPDSGVIEVGDEAFSICFIGDTGKTSRVKHSDIYPDIGRYITNADLIEQHTGRTVKEKAFEGSTQSQLEVKDSTIIESAFKEEDIVCPPYPPECLADFLEADETNFRCIAAKVMDSVARKYIIEAKYSAAEADYSFDPSEESYKTDQKRFRAEVQQIQDFLDSCNILHGFVGVLRRACMDHEAIGWAAIEVIRSFDGSIARIEHIPATRVRVLSGWRGFVEKVDDGSNEYIYYQVFGEKYKVQADDPFNQGKKTLVPFDPAKHSFDDRVPNFVDRETGEPTTDINKAANEILYFPRHHSNTIYYGYSDSVPAVGAIIANSYIRDYQHQFWEHNTVPRYAVIIKGAKVDDEFMKMVTEYFQSHVKGANHKTLIMALGAQGGRNIEVEFKALDVANKEADFLKTRDANSQQIMTAHGVSPAILGIVNNSELGSGKGLSQAEIYKDRIVTPLQEYWAEKLNYLFRQGLGILYARLKFDPLDIRDRYNEMQMLTGYSDRGQLTNNEVRRKANLGPPLPGGDISFIRIREGSFFKLEDLPKLSSTIPLNNETQGGGNPPSDDNDTEQDPPSEPTA